MSRATKNETDRCKRCNRDLDNHARAWYYDDGEKITLYICPTQKGLAIGQ